MNPRQPKSYTSFDKIYFWTATINNWYHLLNDDNLKDIIVNSLRKLSDENKITVYAFVIMPNHIHFIWEQKELNGKETPKGSFLKYTAHTFLKHLKVSGQAHLYEVTAANKKHEIWQRDSLGIEIYSRKFATQKIDYIHNNPMQIKWQLATDDTHYPYSSAKFYEYGTDDFGFLKNIYSVFDGE